jgi:hypothetical protein
MTNCGEQTLVLYQGVTLFPITLADFNFPLSPATLVFIYPTTLSYSEDNSLHSQISTEVIELIKYEVPLPCLWFSLRVIYLNTKLHKLSLYLTKK